MEKSNFGDISTAMVTRGAGSDETIGMQGSMKLLATIKMAILNGKIKHLTW